MTLNCITLGLELHLCAQMDKLYIKVPAVKTDLVGRIVDLMKTMEDSQ